MRAKFPTFGSQLIWAATKSSAASLAPSHRTLAGSFLELIDKRTPRLRSSSKMSWRSRWWRTEPSPITPSQRVLSRSQTTTFLVARWAPANDRLLVRPAPQGQAESGGVQGVDAEPDPAQGRGAGVLQQRRLVDRVDPRRRGEPGVGHELGHRLVDPPPRPCPVAVGQKVLGQARGQAERLDRGGRVVEVDRGVQVRDHRLDRRADLVEHRVQVRRQPRGRPRRAPGAQEGLVGGQVAMAERAEEHQVEPRRVELAQPVSATTAGPSR